MDAVCGGTSWAKTIGVRLIYVVVMVARDNVVLIDGPFPPRPPQTLPRCLISRVLGGDGSSGFQALKIANDRHGHGVGAQTAK